ncbi:MAG: hypothetical protein NC254_02800 [bacterium]|nr:hypothetical protein [bacterium]
MEWFNAGDHKQRTNMAEDTRTTTPGKVKAKMQKLLSGYQKKENISFHDIFLITNFILEML